MTASAPIRTARARVSRARVKRDGGDQQRRPAATAGSRAPRGGAGRPRAGAPRTRAGALPSSDPSASSGSPAHLVGHRDAEPAEDRGGDVHGGDEAALLGGGEVSSLGRGRCPAGRPAAPIQRSWPPGPASTRCTASNSSPAARRAARAQSWDVLPEGRPRPARGCRRRDSTRATSVATDPMRDSGHGAAGAGGRGRRCDGADASAAACPGLEHGHPAYAAPRGMLDASRPGVSSCGAGRARARAAAQFSIARCCPAPESNARSGGSGVV